MRQKFNERVAKEPPYWTDYTPVIAVAIFFATVVTADLFLKTQIDRILDPGEIRTILMDERDSITPSQDNSNTIFSPK